jgi:TIR domain
VALLTKSFIYEKVKAKSGYLYEQNIRNFAASELVTEKMVADRTFAIYDIFVSHSSEDAIYIKGLRDELTRAGFSVYVDWIEDPHLNRANVTREAAAVLRQRMNSCKSLLYAISEAAKKSVWMPWELGYMDSKTKARVAIVPIVEDAEKNDEFKGREYLGLYPYLDKTGDAFYLHESANRWIGFQRWIAGADPL